jgi:predicted O-methyltransferase YrrM
MRFASSARVRTAIAHTLEELEQQRLAQQDAPRDGTRDRDALMLAVGPETARFLNTLLRATGARRALEVGGSMGYSTIWQAEALEATGGTLVSLERVPAKLELLRGRVRQAGLDQVVDVRAGDARELIAGLDGPFDFVLIDAWKADYPVYLDLVWPKLRVGGLIVADNITRPAPPDEGITEYLRRVRGKPDARSQLVPIGSGLELTVKLPAP